VKPNPSGEPELSGDPLNEPECLDDPSNEVQGLIARRTGDPRSARGPPGSKAPSTAHFLTRELAVAYLQNELGVPISFSTVTKKCALGEGPEPACWWGRRPLYTREGLCAWAEARLTRGPTADLSAVAAKGVEGRRRKLELRSTAGDEEAAT
jgi:hypothetical protein